MGKQVISIRFNNKPSEDIMHKKLAELLLRQLGYDACRRLLEIEKR